MTHALSNIPPSSPLVPVVDFEAIKAKQQKTWSSGDFGKVGVRLQIVGETLSEAADILAGERVLDVAAGNGNASLAAARRFAEVVSTDYVPELLQQGRCRAEAEGLSLAFQVADAEALPFPAAEFDVAMSTFGVMFAPDQAKAATEMIRVVKPGGRIALASWTPEGFVGEMFKVIASFVPPPSGLKSPMTWGTETRLVELFGAYATDMKVVRKEYAFRFRSEEHWTEFFRSYYGPTLKAFEALDESRRANLDASLRKLAAARNRSTRGALVIGAEYLEAVITL